MANWLDDLLYANNGVGDRVLDLYALDSDGSHFWRWRRAATDIEESRRTRNYTDISRAPTTGPFKGALVLQGRKGITKIDHGGYGTRIAGANNKPALLTFVDIEIGNGCFFQEAPDFTEWYCLHHFTQGDYAMTQEPSKANTVKLTAGSKIAQITATGGDRFSTSDVFATADASKGLFVAHAGAGNAIGFAGAGVFFAVINRFIDATHVELSVAAPKNYTGTAQWGPFPSHNQRMKSPAIIRCRETLRPRYFGCDTGETGGGFQYRGTTDFLSRGCRFGPTYGAGPLDPDSIDAWHDNCASAYGKDTIRPHFEFTELHGRDTHQDGTADNVNVGKMTGVLYDTCWIHGPFVAHQWGHWLGGGGFDVTLRHTRIWNDNGDGQQATLPRTMRASYMTVDDSNDVIYEQKPSGPAPWETWRAANPDSDWRRVLYNVGGQPSQPGDKPTGSPPHPDGLTWELVFDDEFPGSTLDSTKWRSGLAWSVAGVSYGADHDEEQFYVPAGVVLSGDRLHLTATHADYTFNDGSGAVTKHYQSGAVNTADKFDFDPTQDWTFVEAQVQLSYANPVATFPAFWLLTGRGGAWPWPPEVDIFELFGTLNDPTGHLHSAGATDINLGEDYGTVDLHAAPHVFGLLIGPGKIAGYLDGVQKWAYTGNRLNDIIDPHTYIVLDMALHADYGNPASNTYPLSLDVDWVRAWQGQEVPPTQSSFAAPVAKTEAESPTSTLTLAMPGVDRNGAPFSPRAGDLLLAFIANSNVLTSPSITDPAGWVRQQVHSDSGALTLLFCSRYWKPGDPASFDWVASSGNMSGCLIIVRGADTVDFLDVVAHGFDTAAATPMVAPAVTPADDFDLSLVAIAVDNVVGGTSFTMPGDYEQIARAFSLTASRCTVMVATDDTLGPGTIAAQNFTPNAADQYQSLHVAIRGSIVPPDQSDDIDDMLAGVEIAPIEVAVPVAPSPPTILAITAGDGALGVFLTAPTSDGGGGGFDHYTISTTPALPGGTYTMPYAGHSSGGAVPATNGVTYTQVRVTVTSSAGLTSTQVHADGTWTPEAPSQPTTTNAESIGAGWGSIGHFSSTPFAVGSKPDQVLALLGPKGRKLLYSGRYQLSLANDEANGYVNTNGWVDLNKRNGITKTLITINPEGDQWPHTSDGFFPAPADDTAFYDSFAALADHVRTRFGANAEIVYELGNEVYWFLRTGFDIRKYMRAISVAAPALKDGDANCIVLPGSGFRTYTNKTAAQAGSNLYRQVAGSGSPRMWAQFDFLRDCLLDVGGVLGTSPSLLDIGFEPLGPLGGFPIHDYSDRYDPTSRAIVTGIFPTYQSIEAATGNLADYIVNTIREVKLMSDLLYDTLIVNGYTTTQAARVSRIWSTEAGWITCRDWANGLAIVTNQIVWDGAFYYATAGHTATASNRPSTLIPTSAPDGTSAGVWTKGKTAAYSGDGTITIREADASSYWGKRAEMWFGRRADPDGVWLGGPQASRTRTAEMFPFEPIDVAAITGFQYGIDHFDLSAKPSSGTSIEQSLLAVAGLPDIRT